MDAKPRRFPLAFFLGIACPLFLAACCSTDNGGAEPSAEQVGPREFLFCHWNVENFFDDKYDKRRHKADREFDEWFANNPSILQEKLGKLTDALLKLNGGKGPDILAICEVESIRAAELLQEVLNSRLDTKDHYGHVLMKNLEAGRHIAPAILTRLPVNDKKTRLHGKMLRILEGRILDGKELIVLASHWTSRIGATSEAGREHYAQVIFRTVKDYWESDPKVSVLVCGDFNDTPHDESVVKYLHSSNDLAEVRRGKELLLYNLMGNKDPIRGFGTHYYNGHWFIFDQILVSPGMLGDGPWTCEVDSITTVNTFVRPGDPQKRPWRFGDRHFKGPRGYSDHFPVTVKLKV